MVALTNFRSSPCRYTKKCDIFVLIRSDNSKRIKNSTRKSIDDEWDSSKKSEEINKKKEKSDL